MTALKNSLLISLSALLLSISSRFFYTPYNSNGEFSPGKANRHLQVFPIFPIFPIFPLEIDGPNMEIPYFSEMAERLPPIIVNLIQGLPSVQEFLLDPVTTFSCPEPGGEPVYVPYKRTVVIEKAPADNLCMLVLRTTRSTGWDLNILGLQVLSEGEKTEWITPVARSYDGSRWEASAGPYINSQSFLCDSTRCQTCTQQRPRMRIFPFITSTYELINFADTRQHTESDVIVRFLDQATFGATMDEVNSWRSFDVSDPVSYDKTFAEWIDDQVNTIPLTSHRKSFRERANTRIRSTKSQGLPQHPCDTFTMWHSYSFRVKDMSTSDLDRFVTVDALDDGSDGTLFLFSTNNNSRTEVANFTFDDFDFEYNATTDFPMTLEVCDVEEEIGGSLELGIEGICRSFSGGNPPISFNSPSGIKPDHIITKDAIDFPDFENVVPGRPTTDTYFNINGLNDDTCSFLHIGAYPVFIDFGDGAETRWLSLDPHAILLDNTLDNPISDGGGNAELLGASCSNVRRNIFNADSCILSDDQQACTSGFDFPDTDIILNDENLRKIYEMTKNYVYAVRNLRAQTSPCAADAVSRWRKTNWNATECGDLSNVTDPNSLLTLTNLLENADPDRTLFSADSGFLRDITYQNTDGTCSIENTTPDPNLVDTTTNSFILIPANGECWELVHPDLFNVYDMSPWVTRHPGGPDPIVLFADFDVFILDFPLSHSMERWDLNKGLFPFIGRYMDTVLFQDLPPSLQQNDVGIEFGAIANDAANGAAIICGSENEVANDLTLGNTGFSFLLNDNTDDIEARELQKQKGQVWVNTVLSSNDQLRQRMAWALNQLFAINPEDIGAKEHTEGYLNYYDIFVKNAFGKYFDVLKAVSYSPFMAEMLTFIRSKSPAYILDKTGYISFADENYAREIMQLFSIGTVMLNMNGTSILDPGTGEEIETYTNEQIISFARAWTGFTMQATRGNVETPDGFLNRVDPMYIIPDWRDIFPKVNLFDGFIGDGYPLCEDLPERSYLRKGAVYRLLGSKTTLELANNPPNEVDSTLIKLTLSTASGLYDKLCNPGTPGGTDCNFESLVTLDENILCDDTECEVDTVRQVEVFDGIYYEYVRQPCVELGYYEETKAIKMGTSSISICANPNVATAGEVCCDSGFVDTDRSCRYVNERMTFATASQRCANIGKGICNQPTFICSSACCDYSDYYFWQKNSCMLYAKVLAESGEIAIVHNFTDDSNRANSYFDQDTANYFQVYWEDGEYPSPANNCGDGACTKTDEYCLCDVTIINELVFSEEPSFEEVKSQLFIGSVSPDTYDDEDYTIPTTGDVKVSFNAESLSYDTRTIFEISDNNVVKYFKNIKSTVRIGQYSFRNPPHFMNFADSDARDAYYETDAVIEQYLNHPNVPPFLSKHFLLRFGVSNPTPRQVEVVATAFKTGTYVFVVDANESINFGSGEFGDLEALIAAILLDHEARLLLLDLDPAHGGLKEPILKVIGLMRSMEYNPFPEFAGTNTMFEKMTSKIDQMAYDFASVFSFFRSDFAPSGPVAQASLVAPEGQRYLAPYVIGLMNGLLSLVRFGLSDCDQGFGNGGSGSCADGGYKAGQGNLTFIPSDPSDAKTIVDEIATLLTGGRLNTQSREIIQEEVNKASSDEERVKIAQQLIISSPEFHSTSLTEFSGESRPEKEEVEEPTGDYKALIYLQFSGGLDSYNMIVPHSGCRDKNLYDEYVEVRGNIALDNETLLLIDTGGEPQPCDYFGIHYDLPVLKDLYKDGDLLFFCNVGTLFKDVTKATWRQETKTQLFAHNIGQRDAQRIDPMKAYDGTGVFGRMSDVLTTNGFKTGSISVASENYILVGEPQSSPAPFYVDSRGVKDIFPNTPEELKNKINDVNNASDLYSGLYGETWSQTLQNSIFQTELIKAALENATLFNETLFPDTSLGRQFKMVSKAIKGKSDLGLDRCTFFLNMGGFDTHFDQEEILGSRFETISEAIDAFVKEMRGQGIWKDVAIVTSSDFARTITPNGGDGTDHAWGGNYFALGGSMRGARILGEYPDDLTTAGSQNIGRGRMIPTTSWDSIFNGLAQWFGITEPADLDIVLPNRGSFGDKLFQEDDLF